MEACAIGGNEATSGPARMKCWGPRRPHSSLHMPHIDVHAEPRVQSLFFSSVLELRSQGLLVLQLFPPRAAARVLRCRRWGARLPGLLHHVCCQPNSHPAFLPAQGCVARRSSPRASADVRSVRRNGAQGVLMEEGLKCGCEGQCLVSPATPEVQCAGTMMPACPAYCSMASLLVDLGVQCSYDAIHCFCQSFQRCSI